MEAYPCQRSLRGIRRVTIQLKILVGRFTQIGRPRYTLGSRTFVTCLSANNLSETAEFWLRFWLRRPSGTAFYLVSKK